MNLTSHNDWIRVIKNTTEIGYSIRIGGTQHTSTAKVLVYELNISVAENKSAYYMWLVYQGNKNGVKCIGWWRKFRRDMDIR